MFRTALTIRCLLSAGFCALLVAGAASAGEPGLPGRGHRRLQRDRGIRREEPDTRLGQQEFDVATDLGVGVVNLYGTVPTSTVEKIGMLIGALVPPILVLVNGNAT